MPYGFVNQMKITKTILIVEDGLDVLGLMVGMDLMFY